MSFRPFLSVAALLVSASWVVDAADWPQWRGPQRHGVSQETGLLKQWPAEGPQLRWQISDIGDGYATVAVVGDRLFTLANRGLDNELLEALSAQDGKAIWTTRLGNVGNPDQMPSYPKARSTPTVDGSFLYALSSDGDLASLETTSEQFVGKRIYARTSEELGNMGVHAESPLVDGDLVVVTPGGAEATLVALNKTSGAVVWKTAVPGGILRGMRPPSLSTTRAASMYVRITGKGIVGVDAKTGQFLWRYDEASKGPASMPTPVASGLYVYSAAGNVGGALISPRHGWNGGQSRSGIPDPRPAEHKRWFRSRRRHTVRHDAGGPGSSRLQDRGDPVAIGGNRRRFNRRCRRHLYIHGENGDVALIEATPDAVQ